MSSDLVLKDRGPSHGGLEFIGWPRTAEGLTPKVHDRVRVGTDLVSVDEVVAAVERFGDRYLSRIFTEHEIACCHGDQVTTASRLASRFAAKEAAVKVLRPRSHNPDWRSIEVRRQPQGWCELHLHGIAAQFAREAGIRDLALSLSHDNSWAIAVVVALCEPSLA